jgi:2-succinyl-6-hydroxy-2,4-cyclohexadiene-1-carboxylate synthase
MLLHAERDGAGPTIVLVHGFTQTRWCWGPVADQLAADHEVVRVDAPGHGRSSDVLAGLRTGGRLIADVGGVATYLGYSMGARFCLHLALSNPELVRGLVLLGGTAGIEDPDERATRRRQDLRTAELMREQGLEAFLETWLSQPLFAGLGEEVSFRAERMENTVEGLASSLDQAGTGSQDPSWHRLHQLDMPVLVAAGERDEKFTALGQRMVEEIGANATLALVPGTGHAAHLEAPDAFLAALRPWLADHGL